MKLAIDLEANGLKPTKIWVICCIDVDTGKEYVFRNPTEDEEAKTSFLKLAENVETFIGHNILGYDFPCILDLLNVDLLCDFPEVFPRAVDTLILSKLIDYSRDKHSIEDYGREFNIPKSTYIDYTKYSLDLEERCIIDCKISLKVYLKYFSYLSKKEHIPSLTLEHKFQLIVNSLSSNGFSFNKDKASKLLSKVEEELKILDLSIQKEFLPKLVLIREINPKVTKHGTLSRTDFRFESSGDLSDYNGGPFCRCDWKSFNPSSHKQVIDILYTAGWFPVDKTQTHIDTERELNRLKYQKNKDDAVDLAIKECHTKLQSIEKYGWKINENNLATLPSTAPSPARLLAKRILYESRRRTLTEWLGLVQDDGRIHGHYYGIGAWTHRMAHQKPNTANIPTEGRLFGKEMRSFWQAPKGRLLVGVDAASIQFRVAAEYIGDPELIRKIAEGKKSDKTDPHAYNMKVIGPFCKKRDDSKRTLFSLILGGGIPKLAQILDSTLEQAEEGRDNLYKEYPGLVELKKYLVVEDAKRGWFTGFDGRRVRIPGDTFSVRKHLCPSGYLQCGEAVIMKHACVKWHAKLKKDPDFKDIIWYLVNFVHDEWQTEVPNNMEVATRIAKMQADSLREVGEELKLKCPLAGSYWNEDHKDYTIGTNWYQTH